MQIIFPFAWACSDYDRESNFFFTSYKDDQKLDNQNVSLLVVLVCNLQRKEVAS